MQPLQMDMHVGIVHPVHHAPPLSSRQSNHTGSGCIDLLQIPAALNAWGPTPQQPEPNGRMAT